MAFHWRSDDRQTTYTSWYISGFRQNDPSNHPVLVCYRPTSESPSKWRFASGPMVACFICLLKHVKLILFVITVPPTPIFGGPLPPGQAEDASIVPKPKPKIDELPVQIDGSPAMPTDDGTAMLDINIDDELFMPISDPQLMLADVLSPAIDGEPAMPISDPQPIPAVDAPPPPIDGAPAMPISDPQPIPAVDAPPPPIDGAPAMPISDPQPIPAVDAPPPPIDGAPAMPISDPQPIPAADAPPPAIDGEPAMPISDPQPIPAVDAPPPPIDGAPAMPISDPQPIPAADAPPRTIDGAPAMPISDPQLIPAADAPPPPIDGAPAMQISDPQPIPAVDAPPPPIDGEPAMPVSDPQPIPAVDAPPPPKDGEPAMPVSDPQLIPADDAPPPPIDGAPAMPISDPQPIPAADAPPPPIDGAPAMPISDPQPIPAFDEPPPPIDGAPAMPISDPQPIPAADAPPPPIDGEPAMPVSDPQLIPAAGAQPPPIEGEPSIPISDPQPIPEADAPQPLIDGAPAMPISEPQLIPAVDVPPTPIDGEPSMPILDPQPILAADAPPPIEGEPSMPISDPQPIPAVDAPPAPIDSKPAIPISNPQQIPAVDAPPPPIDGEPAMPVSDPQPIPAVELPIEMPISDPQSMPAADAPPPPIDGAPAMHISDPKPIPAVDVPPPPIDSDTAMPISDPQPIPAVDLPSPPIDDAPAIPISDSQQIPAADAPPLIESDSAMPISDPQPISAADAPPPPIDGKPAMPISDPQPIPAVDLPSPPIDGEPAIPISDPQPIPAVDLPSPPIDDDPAIPISDPQPIPAVDAPPPPMDSDPAMPISDQQPIPAVDAPPPPIDGKPAMPISDPQPIPAADAPPPPIDGAPTMHISDPQQIPAVDVPPSPIDSDTAMPISDPQPIPAADAPPPPIDGAPAMPISDQQPIPAVDALPPLIDGEPAMPISDPQPIPAVDAPPPPIDGAPAMPISDPQPIPAVDASPPPIDGAPAMPISDHQPIPAADAPPPAKDGEPAMPISDPQPIPADDAPPPPIDGAPAMQISDPQSIPADDAPPPPIDGAPAMQISDPQPIPSDDAPPPPIEGGSTKANANIIPIPAADLPPRPKNDSPAMPRFDPIPAVDATPIDSTSTKPKADPVPPPAADLSLPQPDDIALRSKDTMQKSKADKSSMPKVAEKALTIVNATDMFAKDNQSALSDTSLTDMIPVESFPGLIDLDEAISNITSNDSEQAFLEIQANISSETNALNAMESPNFKVMMDMNTTSEMVEEEVALSDSQNQTTNETGPSSSNIRASIAKNEAVQNVSENKSVVLSNKTELSLDELSSKNATVHEPSIQFDNITTHELQSPPTIDHISLPVIKSPETVNITTESGPMSITELADTNGMSLVIDPDMAIGIDPFIVAEKVIPPKENHTLFAATTMTYEINTTIAPLPNTTITQRTTSTDSITEHKPTAGFKLPSIQPAVPQHPPPIMLKPSKQTEFDRRKATVFGPLVKEVLPKYTTTPAPPPPIVIPKRSLTKPLRHRPLYTTTPLPLLHTTPSVYPYHKLVPSFAKTPSVYDPRYLSVAELAELALQQINQARSSKKPAGLQVFFKPSVPSIRQYTTTTRPTTTTSIYPETTPLMSHMDLPININIPWLNSKLSKQTVDTRPLPTSDQLFKDTRPAPTSDQLFNVPDTGTGANVWGGNELWGQIFNIEITTNAPILPEIARRKYNTQYELLPQNTNNFNSPAFNMWDNAGLWRRMQHTDTTTKRSLEPVRPIQAPPTVERVNQIVPLDNIPRVSATVLKHRGSDSNIPQYSWLGSQKNKNVHDLTLNMQPSEKSKAFTGSSDLYLQPETKPLTDPRNYKTNLMGTNKLSGIAKSLPSITNRIADKSVLHLKHLRSSQHDIRSYKMQPYHYFQPSINIAANNDLDLFLRSNVDRYRARAIQAKPTTTTTEEPTTTTPFHRLILPAVQERSRPLSYEELLLKQLQESNFLLKAGQKSKQTDILRTEPKVPYPTFNINIDVPPTDVSVANETMVKAAKIGVTTAAPVMSVVTPPEPMRSTTEPKADEHPPPIFDSKVFKTFMPFPKDEATTRGTKDVKGISDIRPFDDLTGIDHGKFTHLSRIDFLIPIN